MQSLYSYFSCQKNQAAIVEKDLLKHVSDIANLHLLIISILIELVKHSNKFFEEGKQKHLPSEFDLNPNKRFVNNSTITSILSDKKLIKNTDKVSSFWINNDHDIVRKIFTKMYRSEFYKDYIESKDMSSDKDKSFIIKVLDHYILNNELVHHMLEEKSIYWLDDLPFISTILIAQIRAVDGGKNISFLGDVFKNKQDKSFALDLFRKTIENHKYFEEIIIKNAKNWDLDRIAMMDQILLKMALCEILFMEELPVKVSINEYIEISKYYSTAKSKLFINGLIDNMVKDFNKEGKIKKVGRGLI